MHVLALYKIFFGILSTPSDAGGHGLSFETNFSVLALSYAEVCHLKKSVQNVVKPYVRRHSGEVGYVALTRL
jgi:hypothetical protein